MKKKTVAEPLSTCQKRLLAPISCSARLPRKSKSVLACDVHLNLPLTLVELESEELEAKERE